jgi:hypothetical protein
MQEKQMRSVPELRLVLLMDKTLKVPLPLDTKVADQFSFHQLVTSLVLKSLASTKLQLAVFPFNKNINKAISSTLATLLPRTAHQTRCTVNVIIPPSF